MRNFILAWPVLSFLVFFAVQLFAFEPIGLVTKPFLGAFAPHLTFVLRILIVLLAWKYLMPEWVNSFHLSISDLPFYLLLCLIAYAALFLPWPLPTLQLPWVKISLHIFISTWEEILMRGLLLALLLKVYPNNILTVLIFVGCLFGLLHFMNLLQGASLNDVLPQIIWSCALGIAFAVITYRTGSVIPAIILHCGFNLIPAFWDGKPWLLVKANSYGYVGLGMIALIFLPLVLLSLWKAID